ncbi:MAG: sialidase family protein, partial [Terriglobales bacterium]
MLHRKIRNGRGKAAAALLLCAACGWTAAGQLAPAPQRSWAVLNQTPGHYNEPSIAINPNNPSQVVAVFQGNASASYSRDGGRTFTLASGTAATAYRASGDVSVTFDNRGHAFLCMIAFDHLGTQIYWGHNATRNGILCRRSLDGGRTWEKHAAAVFASPTAPDIPFEDKPYIVADNTHSRFAGNLYIGWTQDRLADARIVFSRSTDDGVRWSAPIQLSTEPAMPRDENGTVEGFDGVVTPDGRLHVVWSGPHDDLRYTVSSDGGETFAAPRTIAITGPAHFRVFGLPHGNGYPQIATTTGANGASNLYVT